MLQTSLKWASIISNHGQDMFPWASILSTLKIASRFPNHLRMDPGYFPLSRVGREVSFPSSNEHPVPVLVGSDDLLLLVSTSENFLAIKNDATSFQKREKNV